MRPALANLLKANFDKRVSTDMRRYDQWPAFDVDIPFNEFYANASQGYQPETAIQGYGISPFYVLPTYESLGCCFVFGDVSSMESKLISESGNSKYHVFASFCASKVGTFQTSFQVIPQLVLDTRVFLRMLFSPMVPPYYVTEGGERVDEERRQPETEFDMAVYTRTFEQTLMGQFLKMSSELNIASSSIVSDSTIAIEIGRRLVANASAYCSIMGSRLLDLDTSNPERFDIYMGSGSDGRGKRIRIIVPLDEHVESPEAIRALPEILHEIDFEHIIK